MTSKNLKNRKISFLQMCLTLLFVVALLVSNVITAKQIQLPFGITMTAAVFIFPITYILSDVFSECYGYKWSRITCYMAFLSNLFMSVIFSLAIATPAPSYWHNQDAFQTVLGSTPKVLAASLAAYVVGDFVNDRVFQFHKRRHQNSHEGFCFRAILSSLCGEIIDSSIFLPIVFLGTMPVKTLLTMGVFQVLIKVGYELLVVPLTLQVVKLVSRKERELA